MVETTGPIVRMVNLKKQFGHVEALRGVDMHLNQGEIVGLVGDNGAGKSTLVKLLAGVFPPTSGEIYFEGKQVRWSSPSQSRAAGVEVVYQDTGLAPNMDIARNFFLAKEPTAGLLSLLDFKTMNSSSLKGIAELGIRLQDAEEFVGNLSGGQQRSVAIARSLYFGVKVLILDEPTAGLSIKETLTVLDSVRTVGARGIAVVFITHNINHVFSVADRFVVLSLGRKVWDVAKGDATPEDLTYAIVEGRLRAA